MKRENQLHHKQALGIHPTMTQCTTGHSPGEDPVWGKRKVATNTGPLTSSGDHSLLKASQCPAHLICLSVPSCSCPPDPSLGMPSSLPQSSTESCNEVPVKESILSPVHHQSSNNGHPLLRALYNTMKSAAVITFLALSINYKVLMQRMHFTAFSTYCQ